MNIIEKILYNHTYMYDEYKNCKLVFEKPVLHYRFGRWLNDPLLPVWRRGPQIYIVHSRDIGASPVSNSLIGLGKAYRVVNSVRILTGTQTYKWGEKEYNSDVYENCDHKLPGKLKYYDLVWNSKIRRKLRKYHLSWIKPMHQLPIWMSFHKFNLPLGWKTKWNDYRYEYPPQFTIVFFGLSLSFWLSAPNTKVHGTSCLNNDFYWEAMLEYENCKDINKVIETSGYIEGMELIDGEQKLVRQMIIQPEFVKSEYHNILEQKRDKLKTKDSNKPDVVWMG